MTLPRSFVSPQATQRWPIFTAPQYFITHACRSAGISVWTTQGAIVLCTLPGKTQHFDKLTVLLFCGDLIWVCKPVMKDAQSCWPHLAYLTVLEMQARSVILPMTTFCELLERSLWSCEVTSAIRWQKLWQIVAHGKSSPCVPFKHSAIIHDNKQASLWSRENFKSIISGAMSRLCTCA